MKNEDREMMGFSGRSWMRLLKTALFTFLVIIFSAYVVNGLASLAFNNMSVEQSNTLTILSFCIGIIFTIIFCTFSIIDEIRDKKVE